MLSFTRVPGRRRGRAGRHRGGLLPILTLLAAVLVAATGVLAPTSAGPLTAGPLTAAASTATGRLHDGVFSQAAPRFCTSTNVFTPSNRIRTQIVRHGDGWS